MRDLNEHEIIALAKMYQDVCVNRTGMPSYEAVARESATSPSLARNIFFRFVEDGILEDNEGRKPNKFTQDGEYFAAALSLESGVREHKELPLSTKPMRGTDGLLPEGQRLYPPPQTSTRPAPKVEQPSLLGHMSRRLQMRPDALMSVIKRQIITVARDDKDPVTDEECALVLHTMRKYDLDPMVKQIYAFRSRGKLQIVIGYDGWIKTATEKPGYAGFEIVEEGPEIEVLGTKHTVPAWLKGRISSAGRLDTSIKVYFLEWYDNRSDNWKGKPYHRIRMKLFTQHVREHFGISAMDDIDAEVMARPEGYELSAKMQESAVEKKVSIRERMNREQRDKEVAQAQEVEFEEVSEVSATNEAPVPEEQEGGGESERTGEAKSPPPPRSSPSLFDDPQDPGPAPPPETAFQKPGHAPKDALREAIDKMVAEREAATSEVLE